MGNNNGDCWIKHEGHDPAKPEKHLTSGLMKCFEKHGGRGHQIDDQCLKNVNYWGGDIKRVKANVKRCHQICRETDGCVAFTRNNNRDCWIKREGHDPAKPEKHLTSGLMKCFEK